MKKGDIRREKILETAEKLFFEKGFDHTSVQDILDELKLSKGGFYHHFPSKEAVMAEVCERRILSQLEQLQTQLQADTIRPIGKLNMILARVNLLECDTAEFAALMLKTCYLDMDVRVRVQMQTTIREKLREPLADVLEAGAADGTFFVRSCEQTSRIVLRIAADADDEMCRILARDRGGADTILEITAVLDAARDAIGTLIGAAHGTVVLFDTGRFLGKYRESVEMLRKLGE